MSLSAKVSLFRFRFISLSLSLSLSRARALSLSLTQHTHTYTHTHNCTGVRALVEADKYAEAMHAFNVLAANDPRAQVVLLPLRDGLTIIRRVA